MIKRRSSRSLVVILFGLSEIYGFTRNDFYKMPRTTGLAGSKGFYTVTEFRLNNKLVPYDPADTVRWQDAAFEDWSELSFKVANRPSQIEMAAAGSYPRIGEPYTGNGPLALATTGDLKDRSKKSRSRRFL